MLAARGQSGQRQRAKPRRARLGMIEKYTEPARYVVIEHPGGRHAAVTTDSIRSIALHGDRVASRATPAC
jgi:hypothetical protein